MELKIESKFLEKLKLILSPTMGLSSRPPTKRPVYRSEFVIRLQSMREKRGKNFAFDLLDEPIDWRPSPALSGLSLKLLIKTSQNS